MNEKEIEGYMDYLHHGFISQGLPERMWPGIERYLRKGIEPGDFLIAVFQDKLVDFFKRADDENAFLVRSWASFSYNYLPTECRGEDNYNQWLLDGGLEGRELQKEEKTQQEDHDII